MLPEQTRRLVHPGAREFQSTLAALATGRVPAQTLFDGVLATDSKGRLQEGQKGVNLARLILRDRAPEGARVGAEETESSARVVLGLRVEATLLPAHLDGDGNAPLPLATRNEVVGTSIRDSDCGVHIRFGPWSWRLAVIDADSGHERGNPEIEDGLHAAS